MDTEEILQEQTKDKMIMKIVIDLEKNGLNTKKFKHYIICPKIKLLLFIPKPNTHKETIKKHLTK